MPVLVARLIEEGLDPATPAVMMENVSVPGARRYGAPISKLPALVAGRAKGPSLLLYGRALHVGASG